MSTENKDQTQTNQDSQAESQNTPSESQAEETSSTQESQETSETSSEEEGFLAEATKEEGDDDKSESEEGEEETQEDEEYEIEFSEDSPLSEDQQKKLAEKVGEYGLSKKQAEELIKEIEDTHKNASNSVVKQIADKVKADREALLNSEYFKDESARKENLKKIGAVVKQFGDEDFGKFLNSSAGNSLPLAKFLIKIAEAGEIDDPTTGKGASQDGKGENKSLGEKWYPHFFEKK